MRTNSVNDIAKLQATITLIQQQREQCTRWESEEVSSLETFVLEQIKNLSGIILLIILSRQLIANCNEAIGYEKEKPTHNINSNNTFFKRITFPFHKGATPPIQSKVNDYLALKNQILKEQGACLMHAEEIIRCLGSLDNENALNTLEESFYEIEVFFLIKDLEELLQALRKTEGKLLHYNNEEKRLLNASKNLANYTNYPLKAIKAKIHQYQDNKNTLIEAFQLYGEKLLQSIEAYDLLEAQWPISSEAIREDWWKYFIPKTQSRALSNDKQSDITPSARLSA